MNLFKSLVFCNLLWVFLPTAFAQQSFVIGDALPDAPDLAARGNFKVGVKTLEFINKNQIDVLRTKKGIDTLYDRSLKVEIWYPASLKPNDVELETYHSTMGTFNDVKRPLIPFSFVGRANRNAEVLKSQEKYPLIIVSHGYVGNRVLMTYLTENLASKGYIVAAIDHKESTFNDAGGFSSTLLNRSKDIIFIINQLTILGKSKGVFDNVIDDQNIGLIGYSMGGYGALNVAGAGYSEAALKFFTSIASGSKALETRMIKHPDFQKSIDPRIKAVVALAPWGMERGAWDSDGLKNLKVPTFFIAGSQDDISGYEKGIKAIYNGSIYTDRFLLTYMNARHNVAPNPPPAESLMPGLHFDEYYRYAEPAWNEKRINNINQHFISAFLGIKLKNIDYNKYLNLTPNSNEKTWVGFKARSSAGIELLQEKKQ